MEMEGDKKKGICKMEKKGTCKIENFGRRLSHSRQLLGEFSSVQFFLLQQTYRAMQRIFHCGICGNGHDYKTTQALKKHENMTGHKRRVDAEFSATEEADKRVTKKVRDEKQKRGDGGGGSRKGPKTAQYTRPQAIFGAAAKNALQSGDQSMMYPVVCAVLALEPHPYVTIQMIYKYGTTLNLH